MIQKSFKYISSLSLAGLIALSSLPAFAGAPTDFVKTQTKEVTGILSKKPTARRAKKLDKILQRTVDFEELAARSLGKHWEARTEEEKTKFLGLLQQMLEANYASKLSGKKLGKDFKIEYTREKAREKNGETIAIVGTSVTIETKEGKEVKPVVYKLIKKGDDWIAFDIVIDDISLVETYEESYVAIIEDEGWDELINKMEAKAKELREAMKKKM